MRVRTPARPRTRLARPGNAGQRAPCCRYSRANMHVRHHPVPPLARATPSPIRFCLPTLAPQKRAAPARDASSQDRTCPAMLPLARTRWHCHATSNGGHAGLELDWLVRRHRGPTRTQGRRANAQHSVGAEAPSFVSRGPTRLSIAAIGRLWR
jgi:hypothetical protein